jgi:hypothetical protein
MCPFNEYGPVPPHGMAVENRIGGNGVRRGPAHLVGVISWKLRG